MVVKVEGNEMLLTWLRTCSFTAVSSALERTYSLKTDDQTSLLSLNSDGSRYRKRRKGVHKFCNLTSISGT